MEKANFEEAKNLTAMIDACDWFLKFPDVDTYVSRGISLNQMLRNDDTKQRFLQWVADEKEIAEKRFNEL